MKQDVTEDIKGLTAFIVESLMCYDKMFDKVVWNTKAWGMEVINHQACLTHKHIPSLSIMAQDKRGWQLRDFHPIHSDDVHWRLSCDDDYLSEENHYLSKHIHQQYLNIVRQEKQKKIDEYPSTISKLLAEVKQYKENNNETS